MDVDKVIKLLGRIDLNPSEFFTFKYDELTEKINQSNWDANTQVLKELAITSLQRFHKKPEVFINLFHAAIACQAFYNQTSINLFNEYDTQKLILTLSNTKYWSQARIDLFGGSMALLKPQKIAAIVFMIIPHVAALNSTNQEQFTNAMEMVLNAGFFLIDKKDISLATEVLQRIDRVYVPEAFVSIHLRKKYYFALLKFIKTKQISEINKIINFCNSIGLKHTANDFKDDFHQVKKLYS